MQHLRPARPGTNPKSMNPAQELKSRNALLDDVGWQEATRRVLGLLNPMNEQPDIKATEIEITTM